MGLGRTKQAREFSLRQSRTAEPLPLSQPSLARHLIDFVPLWLQAFGNSRSRRLDVTSIPSHTDSRDSFRLEHVSNIEQPPMVLGKCYSPLYG